MNSLIVGRGEIGNSLYEILKERCSVWCDDLKPELRIMDGCPDKINVIHICIQYSEKFIDIVNYYYKYGPNIINVCSTVPPGTTESISLYNGCHSTSRGLHPNLTEGLKTITKHIGGPKAKELADYFEEAGIPCETHGLAKTTELLHILNNVHYGINAMIAQEFNQLCRSYGVDYYNYMRYTETNNEGYLKLDNRSKVRPILTPPGKKIGGHCLVMSANLIPENKRGDLINKLAHYND